MSALLTAAVMGATLGFSAGLSPGPLMALVIHQSLRYSWREGVKTAFIPPFTDGPIMLLSLLMVSRASAFDYALPVITSLGGVYLCYLGVHTFRSAPPAVDGTDREAPNSFRRAFWVNFFNPHVYLFWMTVGAPCIASVYERHPAAPAAFMAAFFGAIITSKITIALFVGRARNFLQGAPYRFLLRLMGLILIFFALVLWWEAFGR